MDSLNDLTRSIKHTFKIKEFRQKYFDFGFNITATTDIRNMAHKADEVLRKSPSHRWEKYTYNRQNTDEFQAIYNYGDVGVGTVLGYNNLRALDIDGCNDIVIIKKFLSALRLPLEYKWVIRSGSQNGYHILFYCEQHKFENYLGSVNCFMPNQLNKGLFKHLELRWVGHLVLPPSLHDSSNYYSFINCKFPNKKPATIQLEYLEELVGKFCGATANESSPYFFDYPDGYLHNKDYVLKYIPQDLNAPFPTVIEESLISNNHSEEESLILIFDIETVGFPKDWNAQPSNTDNWPRIIQIAFTTYSLEGEHIETFDYLINPEDFSIPRQITEITGISNEIVNQDGWNIYDVLTIIGPYFAKANAIVAHNAHFDLKCLYAEFVRYSISTSILKDKSVICTMKSSVEHCKIEGYNDYKWPKLSELYRHLFNESFTGQHNALHDTVATAKCYWALAELDNFEFDIQSSSEILSL